MLLDAIRSLYSYTTWANQRILEVAATLTPEQFRAPSGAGQPSVRDNLVHIMGAQWIWLARWQGASPSALPSPRAFPTVPSIAARWMAVDAETRQFLDHLPAGQLGQLVAYTNTAGQRWAYPLWQQILHQGNHATQHRSEVAAALTQFGCSPGELDFLIYQDTLAQSR
jgi:uncharacterized damage-inducible protein DinB